MYIVQKFMLEPDKPELVITGHLTWACYMVNVL